MIGQRQHVAVRFAAADDCPLDPQRNIIPDPRPWGVQIIGEQLTGFGPMLAFG
jgi:hypothetical protein